MINDVNRAETESSNLIVALKSAISIYLLSKLLTLNRKSPTGGVAYRIPKNAV